MHLDCVALSDDLRSTVQKPHVDFVMSGTMTTPAEKVNEPETQKSSDEE